MRLKLSNVSSKYGAPMGRSNVWPANRSSVQKLRLVRLQWVDGDYDAGGAYWGNSGGSSIYWATNEQCSIFVRATNRDKAKAQLWEALPSGRFYR